MIIYNQRKQQRVFLFGRYLLAKNIESGLVAFWGGSWVGVSRGGAKARREVREQKERGSPWNCVGNASVAVLLKRVFGGLDELGNHLLVFDAGAGLDSAGDIDRPDAGALDCLFHVSCSQSTRKNHWDF